MKLVPFLLYLSAFWNTTVMNCLQPENWKYCSKDMDVWLYPELVRGFKLLTGVEELCLYCEEKEALDEREETPYDHYIPHETDDGNHPAPASTTD